MRQGDTHLHEYQLDTHSKNRNLTITVRMHRSRARSTQHFDTEAPCSFPTTICIIPCTAALKCSHGQKALESLHSIPSACTKPFVFMRHTSWGSNTYTTPQQNPSLNHHKRRLQSLERRKHPLIAQLTLSLTLLCTHTLKSKIAALQLSVVSGNIFLSVEESKSPTATDLSICSSATLSHMTEMTTCYTAN